MSESGWHRVDALDRYDRYGALPLEVVARHEAGHAVMAHRCGGSVRRIVLGRRNVGDNYGHAFWTIPDSHRYLLVLTAGSLALFMDACPRAHRFAAFRHWAETDNGRLLAISGGGDWIEILRRTGEPEAYGLDDFLERAVRPYFDEAIEALSGARDQLDDLTTLLLAHPPGLGPLALKRFFAGKPQSLWAQRLDRPGVLWVAKREEIGE